jgi:hypothetical protein
MSEWGPDSKMHMLKVPYTMEAKFTVNAESSPVLSFNEKVMLGFVGFTLAGGGVAVAFVRLVEAVLY